MFDGKIILSSLIYGKFPFKTALAEIKRLGFDTFELAVEPELCPHYDLLVSTERTDIVFSTIVRKSGLNVSNLNIGDSMEQRTDIQTNKIRQLNALRLARRLEVKKVVFSPGILFKGMDFKKRQSEMLSNIIEIAGVAEKMGITICIEAPHKMSIAETPSETEDFWSQMPDKVKCSFDTAHVVFGGGNPVEAIRLYAGRIANVHLRDGVKGNTFVPYGTGCVDFSGVFNSLSDLNYKGTCSIEFLSSDLLQAEGHVLAAVNLLKQSGFPVDH